MYVGAHSRVSRSASWHLYGYNGAAKVVLDATWATYTASSGVQCQFRGFDSSRAG